MAAKHHIAGVLAALLGPLTAPPLLLAAAKDASSAATVLDLDSSTTFGILIDAGSTGSRVHIYQWAKRDFATLPPPLSLPLTSERWTERIRPGLSDFPDDPEAAAKTLLPLLDVAKQELGNYKHAWSTFPVYVKATAGMRELPEKKRDGIVEAVRALLASNETCPFDFANKEQARVIAGEEEAAYAWVAVNFVDGALLEATSGPFGTAVPIRARGSMEMGGSSAQISFYKPDQDILAGLFKLQIGTRAHVNLYAHSFLHYGRVSARRVYWSYLAKEAGCWRYEGREPVEAVPCVVEDPCLVGTHPHVPREALVSVTGVYGLSPPILHHPVNENVTIVGPGPRTPEAFERCLAGVRASLFDVAFNRWCEYSHRGQCAFVGVYQPALPRGPAFGNVVLLGNYVKLFTMLGLPATGRATANVDDVLKAAAAACGEEGFAFPIEGKKHLAANELCFVAAYAYEMFVTGHGFTADANFTTITETTYRGATVSVGWQLGAMLYEINALPWHYEPNATRNHPRSGGLFLYEESPAGGGLRNAVHAGAAALAAAAAFAAAFRRKRGNVDPEHFPAPVPPASI